MFLKRASLKASTSHTLASRSLLLVLIRRDISERYLGTISGLLWAFLGPVLTLLIFAFVFQTLMKVRVPSAGAGGFVPFLALGLWPWYAFSDALGRGTQSIVSNASLLGKIAMPRYLLVLVPVISSFAVHTLGMMAVIIGLAATGTNIHFAGLGITALCMLAILLLATGAAFWLSTLNVFMRDVSALLPQVLTFWMLITPIFFHAGSLSPTLSRLLAHNPMMAWIEIIRAALLGMPQQSAGIVIEASVVTLFLLGSGFWVFRRAESHFEDYL